MTYAAKPQVLLRAESSFCLRKICIKIAQSRIFENFIMLCILLNTLVMALVWSDQPIWLFQATEILNYSFNAIFTVEAIIKIVALKKAYFRDLWNLFDFSIIMLTMIILILKASDVPLEFASFGPTILRALRIGRILRLIK